MALGTLVLCHVFAILTGLSQSFSLLTCTIRQWLDVFSVTFQAVNYLAATMRRWMRETRSRVRNLPSASANALLQLWNVDKIELQYIGHDEYWTWNVPEIAIHREVEGSLEFAAAPHCKTKVGAGTPLKLPSLMKSRGQPPFCCSSINQNGIVNHERSVKYVKCAVSSLYSQTIYAVFPFTYDHGHIRQGPAYISSKACTCGQFTHCLMATSINNLLISVASHARLSGGDVLMLVLISLRGCVVVELRSSMHNYFMDRNTF